MYILDEATTIANNRNIIPMFHHRNILFIRFDMIANKKTINQSSNGSGVSYNIRTNYINQLNRAK